VTVLKYLLAEEGQLDLFLQMPESSAVEFDAVVFKSNSYGVRK
jgi:hypothetical protein